MAAQRGPGGKGGRRPILLAALALGLFVLAAAALPEGLSLFDEDTSNRLVLPSIPSVFQYLIGGIGALMVVILILLRVTVMRDEVDARSSQRSRWRYVALVLVGLALWATFASYRQNQATSEDGRPLPVPSASPTDQSAGSQEEGPPPRRSETFGIVVGSLFVLALGAMTVALLLLFRQQKEDLAGRSLQEELIQELDAGLDGLHNIDDPRAAVIACYSRMETVVQLAGVQASPSDTPFELLARILLRADVSEESARRLTELFEEAKFSTKAIDEPMRQEALSAIGAVREEIAAGRAMVATS